MQRCLQCGEKFEWKRVYQARLLRFSQQRYACSHCGAEHELRHTSRLTASFFILIPFFVFLALFFPFERTHVVALVVVMALTTLAEPFIVRYELKEASSEKE